MSPAQQRMLATVADIGMCSRDVLVEVLSARPSVVAHTLDALFRRGLVTITPAGDYVVTRRGLRRLGFEVGVR